MKNDRISDFKGSVFFYVSPPGPPERAAYQHSIICLAEGLADLGIPFFANLNYWRIAPEDEKTLFNSDPEITPDDCDIVILDQFWFDYGGSIPKNLFHPGRGYIAVYMDWSDGYRTRSWKPEFRDFDFIFRTHWNRGCSYPSNLHPWAFGSSNRIIRETREIPDYRSRRQVILNNPRIRHSLRKIVQDKYLNRIREILPLDETVENLDEFPSEPYHYLQWKQSGRRHYPAYYRRLCRSAASACFGGYFLPPALPGFISGKVLEKLWFKAAKKAGLTSDRVAQWDSWRFWESLDAGCVPFQLDFEKYGLSLPVMPRNWRHYIGIDLDNISAALDRIRAEPEILEEISSRGRDWALKHYSPVPTTLRFLDTVLK